MGELIANDVKVVAMKKAGVTRELAYSTLYKHLTAVKTETRINEVGEKISTEVDDYSTQEKALEKALKVFGDIKPDACGTNNVANIAVMNPEMADKILMALTRGRGNVGQTG